MQAALNTEHTVYKSRWGFHPCDYPTFKLIKRLRRAVEKARHVAAAYNRWEAKSPRKRGNEPKLSGPLLGVIDYVVSFRDIAGNYAPVEHEKAVVIDHGIIAARFLCLPVCEESLVESLPLNKAQIMTLLEELGLPTNP